MILPSINVVKILGTFGWVQEGLTISRGGKDYLVL